jgi:ligand-binding SRPBCC domain-containing protein
MGFQITNISLQEEMYEGQLISYKVRPILNVPLRWVTEITHVREPYYFVDEQRFGPYSFWHHQHVFEENSKGVFMKDIVTYGIPLGPLGRLANTIYVRKQLEGIFNYRVEAINKIFPT